MAEFLKNIDFSPLIISLKTGLISIIFIFIIGTILAFFVTSLNRKLKIIIDSVFTLPLVLPPTVAGYLLLLIFSLRRPFGNFLNEELGIRIVQSFSACVISSFVIAFPLMYQNARTAFEQVDQNLIFAGKTLGLSERKIFFKIIIPNAKNGLIAGGILSFARAIGEYGATSMLAGNILGKTRTISMAIYTEVSKGNYKMAGFWTIVIVIIAFIIMFLTNFYVCKKRFK